MWNYREDKIMAASQQEIVDKINTFSSSPTFGFVFNISDVGRDYFILLSH